MEFECFFQFTHFSSFKFKLIPILEPKFSLEINSCDIKVIITLKFESFSWSIQWNSTWFKPIPVLGPTGNPIFRFYVIENLGTISYKPLQLLLQKWHFSDKNSAITRRGIKISKNGLHPRIRRAILHRHTNFQPNLSHSGNHLFPVDTLPWDPESVLCSFRISAKKLNLFLVGAEPCSWSDCHQMVDNARGGNWDWRK